MFMENPERFNRAVLDFIASTRREAADRMTKEATERNGRITFARGTPSENRPDKGRKG